jgi:putative DNA primase/helicase
MSDAVLERRLEAERQVEEAKSRAFNRWPDLLAVAGLDDKYLRLKRNGPCPFCGGTDRYSFTDKYGDGSYYCRKCGGGDGMKLLEYVFPEKRFMERVRWVLESLGAGVPEYVPSKRGGDVPRRAGEPLSAAEFAKRKAKHRRLWNEARRITEGDPVWKHLHRRLPELVQADIPAVLRYHPALEYWEFDEEKEKFVQLGKFPGMVAAIQGPDGVCCNIHRTFLTEDGEKAPVPSVRKKERTLEIRGGAIRLFAPVARELSVAEGIETSLAVNIFRGESCWSMVDAGGMEEFDFSFLNDVDLLRIYQDNDLPDNRGIRRGFRAGEKLAERAKALGKRVVKYAPAKAGMDMDDFVRSLPKRA